MTEATVPTWTGEDLSDAEFTALMELLRDRRQFDLEQYKDRCVRRRIAKRLRIAQAADFSDYLKILDIDPDELDALLATISIHVSQFFRNPGTFQILEKNILPDLCRQARASGRHKLTLWSAGCASGEEPYSLAMLVDDLGAADLEIRILATDISEPVLEKARAASFEAARLREVPEQVIKKYFCPDKDRYQLISRVRDRVEFIRHNIVTDRDYPVADLILCRNVLIYFTRPEQERILARFAEVIQEHGALVLGRAETMIGKIRGCFQAEFPVERIYRRTAQPATTTVLQETGPREAPGVH
jgi:chemotaxis protein methyltransferase CheR